MIRALATALALALAPAALAQDLSPDTFERLTEGRAFATHYSDGTLQGIEVFLPGRAVIWQETGGPCLNGIWQVENGLICYLYEGANPGYCLSYRAGDGALIGTADTGEVFLLREVPADKATCPRDPLLSRVARPPAEPRAATARHP
jgi:hypothetical protein